MKDVREIQNPLSVTGALKSRVSVRAYTDEPVDEVAVRDILDTARWSPSGSNMQPWKVIVVAGAERAAVVELAHKRIMANPAGEEGDFPILSEEGDYPVLPEQLAEPYRMRRFRVAAQRYAVLGILRDDKVARSAILARNYDFWGAPVGLFFVIDKSMGHAQWAHLGMFMQSIALVAQERGLATCMQEAWALVRDTLHAHFALPKNELIYCGMALGHAEPSAPINAFRSERIAVDGFATFRG